MLYTQKLNPVPSMRKVILGVRLLFGSRAPQASVIDKPYQECIYAMTTHYHTKFNMCGQTRLLTIRPSLVV